MKLTTTQLIDCIPEELSDRFTLSDIEILYDAIIKAHGGIGKDQCIMSKLDFNAIEGCFPEGPGCGESGDGRLKVSAQWLHDFAYNIERHLNGGITGDGRGEAAPYTQAGKAWAIDHSAGRPILVLNGCSVIEAEDAEYVLSLVRNADATPPQQEQAAPGADSSEVWPIVNLDVAEDGTISNAKLYSPGLPAGNHDVYPVRVPYMDEHTEAWYAVIDALNKVRPGFLLQGGKNGIECAVLAIQSLAAPGAVPAEIQAVIEAARQWWCERTPQNWDDAELAKAVIRLDGDWPGCPDCDHDCGEPCMPATMQEQLRAVDCHIAQLVHEGKLYPGDGYKPPEGWEPLLSRSKRAAPAHGGRPMTLAEIAEAEGNPMAAPVPDGFVLVPIEPTPEMLSAGVAACSEAINTGPEDVDTLPICYRAMIAAAPKAQEPTV